jgi:hypothetical protein
LGWCGRERGVGLGCSGLDRVQVLFSFFISFPNPFLVCLIIILFQNCISNERGEIESLKQNLNPATFQTKIKHICIIEIVA